MPLATPTLSVADNAAGTGGVATVAGATAGTTNTIHAAPWTGGLVGAAFTSYGSRVGNGTVNVATANGYFWGAIQSTDGVDTVWSSPIGFRTTSGEESVYYQCLLAVQAAIQAIGLSGIAAGSVKVRKFPWNRNLTAPGIFVCPTKDFPRGGYNSLDNIVYGVSVAIVKAANQDLETGLAAWLELRQQVHRAFRQSVLAAVAEIYNVEVEPGATFDWASFNGNYDVQGMTINCVSREIRGVA